MVDNYALAMSFYIKGAPDVPFGSSYIFAVV